MAVVHGVGELQLGRSAGYSSRDSSFRGLGCGYRASLSEWTHVAWLVSRDALDAGVVDRHGIILPESLIDRDAQPHAHRWLRGQPLVCVAGVSWRPLAADGVCVYRVVFDATGDRLLQVQSTGGTLPSSLTVRLDALDGAMAASSEGRSTLDLRGDPSPIDRALRLMSGGELDECSVVNAFHARCLIEQGYGYHGALEGRFTPVERISSELRRLDALFGQIFARAGAMRATAKRLLSALARATPEAVDVPVPLYGQARRVIIPALKVTQVERLVVAGETKRDLELPSERRWSVDGVDAWSPQLPGSAR